jgi:hypothetical protein
MDKTFRGLKSIDVKWNRFVKGNPIRLRQFEKKFGKYASTNIKEFMAEIWSAYVLDPERCDPDVKRIGELLNRIIEEVIDVEELARQIKERLEQERKERGG